MKRLKYLTAALAIAAALTPVSSAAGAEPYNWYVKRENGVPVCPPEMSCSEEHDCRFIDREAAASGDRVVYLTFDAGYENGNVEKADKMYSLCEEFGWIPVSMKNDWTTIYGDGVTHK